MPVRKIGTLQYRGQDLCNKELGEATLLELIIAMRQELDNLYTKLNDCSISEQDFGSDTSEETPCYKLFDI